MDILSVGNLWKIKVTADHGNPKLQFTTNVIGFEEPVLVEANIPGDTIKNWHHIAYTFRYEPDNSYIANVYWDGNQLDDWHVLVNGFWFEGIANGYPYKNYMKTEPLIIGSNNSSNNLSAVKAIDELRLWNTNRSAEEIKSNFKKTILQSQALIGYYNFDDRRNRLKTVSDISYQNNIGIIRNDAYFIPENPEIEHLSDEIFFTSSNAQTDSIKFAFVDNQNTILYSQTNSSNQTSLIYDISALPYETKKLQIREYYTGCPDTGFVTNYGINVAPPTPIATPKYNWSTFYQSDGLYDELKNTILVSGLPANTTKVKLGLEKDSIHYDITNFSRNSVPYRYSLTLNGMDNYVETSNKVSNLTDGTISFWFKTTTGEGGKLIGFSETSNGINSNHNEPEIIMEKDGTIRFIINSVHTLYGEHAYNDGEWHHISAGISDEADLYIDGTLVDHKWIGTQNNFDGYWIIGRNHANNKSGHKSLAEFWNGSLAQLEIQKYIGAGIILYKFDEGVGANLFDSYGSNNGILMGGTQRWAKFESKLSFVFWEGNMINKEPGVYTFYANVYYDGDPETGTYYPLGKFNIAEPVPGENHFNYSFQRGIGFFNEGVLLENTIYIKTNYTSEESPSGSDNLIQCVFLSPDHWIIQEEAETYEVDQDLEFTFDMGDAPVGSYMSIQTGYLTTDNDTIITHSFSVPIYINRLIAPTVSGNFGPFEQAIAPGTMAQENTFVITTEHLDDLNKITGKFYNQYEEYIGESEADQINDTTWHLKFEMGKLPPPHGLLKVEYFLGQDPKPVLVEGPYKISISKTRPAWFDFLDDDEFSDISETDDEVTFSLETYLSKKNKIRSQRTFTIPKGVPLLGGTDFETQNPTVKAYLKYIKSENKLELKDGKHPIIHKELLKFKIGPPEVVDIDFQTHEDDSYSLDSDNDLTVTQNFGWALDFTWSIKRIVENPATKLIEVYKYIKAYGWSQEKPIGPTANFTISLTLGGASRLHYQVDTNNGDWGSFGTLNIDSNPNHNNYKKSASYDFMYVGGNGELSLGVTLGYGTVDVYVALAFGIYAGFGKSYIDIPKSDKHHISTFMTQMYFRVYLTALWSWYEVDLYGPKILFRTASGDDDMADCLPPFEDGKDELKYNETELSDGHNLKQLNPVGWYTKMPLPQPNHSISLKDKHRLFTWLEPGNNFGERKLRLQHFDSETGRFSESGTISVNRNAIQKPKAEMINDQYAICTWMQTRHNPESFGDVKSEDVVESIIKSQDIWYSVYDLEKNETIVLKQVDDNSKNLYSGRAEANPEVTVLSENRAIITWQVADFEAKKSEIWFTEIEKSNGIWTESEPKILASPAGTQTHLRIASPEEDIAVAVWKNFDDNDYMQNRLISSTFDGEQWSEPIPIAFSDTSIHYNYFDMEFENNKGAIVYSTYSKDPTTAYEETLAILPWDYSGKKWNGSVPIILHTEDDYHIQLPRITINSEGKAAVGFKLEKPGLYVPDKRISQVDLLIGDLTNTETEWTHKIADELICDTTKQVSDLEIAFAGGDTLMILSHEFVMSATNTKYKPTNGIVFGHNHMNQVLRAVTIDEDENIEDVDENDYFENGNDTIVIYHDVALEQNFPNPCSNSTKIKFYLPEETNARLEVFNINGLLVATIINQPMDPGQYELELNTSMLKQGKYFYTLTTDRVTKSKKMIVGN